jgi:hypothetical protein
VRASYARRQKEAGTRPVFQSSAAYEKTNVEVDVILGELNSRTTPKGHQTGSTPTGMNFRIP